MSEPNVTSPTDTQEPPKWLRALRSLRDRRMLAMLLLALAAGLPYGAVLGTLTAWLTQEGVTPSTIGVLSIITLGYSYKYLWAPLFQTPKSPPFLKFGARRSWLILFQVPMAILLAVLALSHPAENIGFVAIIALIIALLSATHDIVLDAWRIEVARTDEDKDLMAALYQFGYRSALFITGFVALLMAARVGWALVYCFIGLMMLLAVAGTLIAPEPVTSAETEAERTTFQAGIPRQTRDLTALIVAIGWLIAAIMIGRFMVASFTEQPPPNPGAFVRDQGPWIVGLTVILPALLSTFMLIRFRVKPMPMVIAPKSATRFEKTLATLFRAIFDPLMELIGRLKWGALLVLLLALTYRFADSVWGAFAYPFYLDDRFGALHHSLDDVAIASKFFGVLMTIAGAAIGVAVITFIGSMPVMLIGALVAAATNLIFADLSAGGATMDAFLQLTHLGEPLREFAGWAAKISPDPVAPDQGQRMARLMMAIAAENLAGGFASVAIVAFLTSVVNPRFAAVQYALLASLTMLIGSLGRPWLGGLIETDGYYDVFVITFWLGMVPVALCVIEWIRQLATGDRGKPPVPEVEDVSEA